MNDFESKIIDRLDKIDNNLSEHMARTKLLEQRTDWIHEESSAKSELIKAKIDSDLTDIKNQLSISQWILPVIVTVILFMFALGFKP